MRTSGRNERERRGVVWTVAILALVAIGFYVGFILLTATQN
jgi:hypothetical protein